MDEERQVMTMMMSVQSVTYISVILTLMPYLAGGQVACPKVIYVGNPIATPAITPQPSHGKSQTVVVYGPEFTIPCTCGVITGWDLMRYDNPTDGCAKYLFCNTTMMVFRDVTISPTLTAKVVGTYSADLNTFASASVRITLPRTEYIPVQFGDYLGWSGQTGSIVYFEEACGGSCPSGLPSSNKFLFTSVTAGATTGSTMTFTNGPDYSYPNNRYYGFRAFVYQGTAPYFTYIPPTISIVDITPVGTVVSRVVAADGETKQTLTLSILRSCPQASYFSIDPVTGDISVNQSLVGSESLHVLTIQVSDSCLTANSDVTVQILRSPTVAPDNSTVMGLAPTTSPSANVLSSGPGYGLIVSAAVSCLAAIGASVGVCVFCSQLSDLQKQLDLVKGMKPNASGGKNGDGRFLYNTTEDRLKDRKLRSYAESDRKSAENLDSSSNKGWSRPHERSPSSASVHMSSSGHGSPI